MKSFKQFFTEQSAPRTVAVYAGRFHPFHIGHAGVFDQLARRFGPENVYITTSGKVDPPNSPFTFQDKKLMMKAAGIPEDHIVEEASPYMPKNLTAKLSLDPERDYIVFGIGRKDMAEDPRFSFKPLKSGAPSYFQPYEKQNFQPLGKHGYIFPVEDINFKVNGESMKGATQIRKKYKESTENERVNILKTLYPNSSDSTIQIIKNVFDSKLK
jgi:hypothetical protein